MNASCVEMHATVARIKIKTHRCLLLRARVRAARAARWWIKSAQNPAESTRRCRLCCAPLRALRPVGLKYRFGYTNFMPDATNETVAESLKIVS